MPAVRNITLAYTLAGADCIDVAADPAVVAAAKEALQVAGNIADDAEKWGDRRPSILRKNNLPLLMVSLNDGEDPHFRKAQFDANLCPADCPRPCEQICPAQAIVFDNPKKEELRINNPRTVNSQSSIENSVPGGGVIEERCYGCGRCVPVCPLGLITTRSYVSTPTAIAPTVLSKGVDAVEIHTSVGRLSDFKRLWSSISPWVDSLKAIAISCPDGPDLIDYLWAMYETISPLPCALIWQTDGRPMSGDIGIGTTHATVKLGQKVLAAGLPGYVQLAGGTNHHTVAKLKAMGLLKSSVASRHPYIAGVAYGSYARVQLTSILEQLEERSDRLFQESEVSRVASPLRLEDFPDLLWQAVDLAYSLVAPLKFPVQYKCNTNNTVP